MNSVNVMLRKDKLNKKGECPIYVRIISNRQSSYIPTGIKSNPQYWNDKKGKLKSSFPNSTAANNLIDSIVNKVKAVFYNLETTNRRLSAKEIKTLALNNNKELLIPFMESWILERLNRNEISYSTYKRYLAVIDKIRKTFGENLEINQFDVGLLKKFDNALRTVFKNSTNTIAANFSFLRAVANNLIEEDKMKLNDYPFRKWKLKFEEVKRKYLTPDQIKEIENIILPNNSKQDLSRKIFLLCNQEGFRIGDALTMKVENFTGTHFVFLSQKTKTYTNILATKKAIKIISPLIGTKTPESYIFDFLTLKNQSEKETALKEQKMATALINKNLALISKRLGFEFTVSTHYARHSMATNALAAGLSLEEIKSILHHKDIQTTQIYAKAVDSMKDAAMKKIG